MTEIKTRTQGGSYMLDAESGALTLVERTEGLPSAPRDGEVEADDGRANPANPANPAKTDGAGNVRALRKSAIASAPPAAPPPADAPSADADTPSK